MNDIEREIEELEELIRLQRQKCDLLHRKNAAASTSPVKVSSLETTSNPMMPVEDEGEDEDDDRVTKNALHDNMDKRSAPDFTTRVSESVRHMMMSTTDFKDNGNGPQSTIDEEDEERETDNTVLDKPRKLTKQELKEERSVDALARLSRLNTDLANERNLLAWARTALASARTFNSFVGVTAITEFGRVSRQVCYLGFSVMSIYIIVQGTERYNRIKRIVYLKKPPLHFERLTNAPLPICLALLFCLGLMSVSFDQWES